MNFAEEFESCLRAGCPALWVVTAEEGRALYAMAKVADGLKRAFARWTVTRGWTGAIQEPDVKDPISALEVAFPVDPRAQVVRPKLEGPTVLVLQDLYYYLESPQPDLLRRLREVLNPAKAAGQAVVVLAPRIILPQEIEKEFRVLAFPLPDRATVGLALDVIVRSAAKEGVTVGVDDPDRAALVEAALGLTVWEAENAFALALQRTKALGPKAIGIVNEEKAQLLKKSGLLDYYPPSVGLKDVGGLDLLKSWLRQRRAAFGEEARRFGLDAPKGILLLGPPGVGKSLAAKAIAEEFAMPLLRLDFSRLFGKFVGETEGRMRDALALAEAVAPCLCWADELEKGAGGMGGLSADGGTTQRAFGYFLSWMQERTAPVFLVATCNQVVLLPPEFLRAGRFDAIFFVDLPIQTEREEILRIHLAKRGWLGLADGKLGQGNLVGLIAEAADGYSGAELEQVIVSGLFTAFGRDRQPTLDDFLQAAREVVPLSLTRQEEIEALRKWARVRARPASATQVQEDLTPEEAQKAIKGIEEYRGGMYL